MFKRLRKRYYNITLASPSIPSLTGTTFNASITIMIRGKVTRDKIYEALKDAKDDTIVKTIAEYPILIAWSEVDEM